MNHVALNKNIKETFPADHPESYVVFIIISSLDNY